MLSLTRCRQMVGKAKSNRTFRNGILFSFFSFLNSGISFFLLLILANYISPSGYGELNLFTTSVTLLSFLISLNTTGILAVEFFKVSRKEFSLYLNSVLLVTIAVFLFGMAVLGLFSQTAGRILGIAVTYQWMALVICFLQVFSTVNLEIWRLEEKPLSYGLYSVSIVFFNFLLTLFFVIGLNSGWQGRVYAQVSIGFIFFIISIVFLIKRKYLLFLFPGKTYFKSVLSFGIPLIPHNTTAWMRQGLDRYIINYFYLPAQVGLYSFAYNFANIIQIIGMAFNATNSVFIYKQLSEAAENSHHILRKQTIYMIFFFILATLLISIGSSVFIPFVLPKYTDSIIYLIPLCIAALFQCIYYLFTNYLFFYKKTKQLMYITVSVSVFHVLLSLWLTRYSIMYTAYITMLSNALFTLAVFLYSRRICKVF